MPKILIIDDEASIRNTLREILEYEKYAVEEASDGEIGLQMLESNEYDVVLCDIKMPKLDGIEVIHIGSLFPVHFNTDKVCVH